MKHIIVMILGMVMGISFATAQTKASKAQTKQQFIRPYGLAGCGLGSVLMGRKGAQIFAATTNGTSWNQTFGISAGTLNCVDGPNNEVAQRMDNFIIVNKAALANDMARGQGEALNSLSAIVGCGDVQKFGASMQRNFNEIYTRDNVQPNEVTDSVISVIKSDEELTKACAHVS